MPICRLFALIEKLRCARGRRRCSRIARKTRYGTSWTTRKSLGRATKSEIASAIGIRPSHFSNLLNGRNEWKLNQLEKLAAFLGVPLARLFEERNPDPGNRSL